MACTHTSTVSCLPSKSSTETDDNQLFLELISLSSLRWGAVSEGGRERLTDRDVCFPALPPSLWDDPPHPPTNQPPPNLVDQTKDIICRPSLFLSVSLVGSAYQSNTAQGKKATQWYMCVCVNDCVCVCVCVCVWAGGWKVCLPLRQASIYPFLQFISPPCLYDPFRSASRGGTRGKDVVGPRHRLLTPAQNSSTGPGTVYPCKDMSGNTNGATCRPAAHFCQSCNWPHNAA